MKGFKKPKATQGHLIKAHGSKAVSDEDRKPKFSLRLLQPSHCISQCEKDDRAAFAEKMRRLSQLTWAQIRQQDRHGLGFEKISHDAIKVGIPEEAKAEKLIAFRFSGPKPMVGFKKEATFYVVWFDRDFTLYNH